MGIQKYFDDIKKVIDQYSATNFVLDMNLHFDIRPGEQGYWGGVVYSKDNSTLYFKEFVDSIQEETEKLMYVYHYQDSENQLIFRYDTAMNKPQLPYLEHKHTQEGILKDPTPTLSEVLEGIFTKNDWM